MINPVETQAKRQELCQQDSLWSLMQLIDLRPPASQESSMSTHCSQHEVEGFASDAKPGEDLLLQVSFLETTLQECLIKQCERCYRKMLKAAMFLGNNHVWWWDCRMPHSAWSCSAGYR